MSEAGPEAPRARRGGITPRRDAIAPRRDAATALRRRATTAIRRRRDVRRRGSPDDVHDLRVASRRLQEVIDLLAWAMPEGPRRRARRRVKRIRRALAEVRDADVQQALVASLAARLGPAAARPLQPLRTRLRARATAARDARSRAGAGLRVHGLRGRVRALLQATASISRASLQAAARRALAARAAAVDAARARALAGNAAALHALRIAVKKYRYTLEFMDEVGLGRHGEALAGARHLQESLGRLHDLDLLIGLARRARGAVVPGLLALLRRERGPLLAAARAEAAAFTPKRPVARRSAGRPGAPPAPPRSPIP